jgi:hypothetical protein
MRLSIHGLLVAVLATAFAGPVVVAQEMKPATADKFDRHGDPLPAGASDRLGSIRLRHAGVNAIAFSADGRTLASLSDDGTAQLWQIPSGKWLRSQDLAKGSELRFMPNGELSADGKLRVVADMKIPDAHAVAAMQAAADAMSSLEARQRLRSLLRRLDDMAIGTERIRMLRAIETLERVGTIEARDALRDVQTFGNRELGEAAGEAVDRVALRLPTR